MTEEKKIQDIESFREKYEREFKNYKEIWSIF